jgi:OOP family OmpA-OmpF porin
MIKSILAISLLTASGVVMAHSIAPVEGDIESSAGYISVGGGSVLKTGKQDCLKTGTFSEANAIGACEGETAEEPTPEPVAEAKPAAKPLKAQVETANLSGVSLFNTGSDVLNAAGIDAMEGLYSKLDAYKGVTDISVIGHTDSRGSEANNQDLSERRAANIAALLQERYNDAKIVSKGMGESSPIASNDTAEGRQQNRRVEVQITAHRMIFN